MVINKAEKTVSTGGYYEHLDNEAESVCVLQTIQIDVFK